MEGSLSMDLFNMKKKGGVYLDCPLTVKIMRDKWK